MSAREDSSTFGNTTHQVLLDPTDPSQFKLSDFRRSWIDRTFSPLSEGGIRGNIFLLIITTIGSSFFYLPFLARQIGLYATVLMLFMTCGLSYACSSMLYLGFKYTKAKTYSECMEVLLGKRIGFLSNVIVMVHTIGAVMSTLIFSYTFISSGIMQFFDLRPESSAITYFRVAFFPTCFVVMFFVTMLRSIERLKAISIVGLVLLLYLVSVFVYLTPQYFDYFDKKGEIHIKGVIFSWYMLKVWGITNYMFLNQYAIMPICANVKNVSFKRITKVVRRTMLFVLAIYLLILFCGYFSLPSDSTNEIFLLRDPIPGADDSLIMYGKLLFGTTLLVAAMVKSHFMLTYLDQLVVLYRNTFLRPADERGEAKASDNINVEEAGSQLARFARRFVFLAVHGTLTFFGIDYLSKILGFVGSFVGVFEMIIIPGYMVLIMDSRNNYMSPATRRAFVGTGVVLSIVTFAAVIYNIIYSK